MKNVINVPALVLVALSLTGCISENLSIAGGNSYVYAPNSYILKVKKGSYTNITVTGYAGILLATHDMPNEVKTFCNDGANKGETIISKSESGETIELTCPS